MAYIAMGHSYTLTVDFVYELIDYVCEGIDTMQANSSARHEEQTVT